MSPWLSNVPASGTTTKLSSLASFASFVYENMEISETQKCQTQHMSNDTVVDCSSSTKDKTIGDFSIKVTSASEKGIARAEKKQVPCNQCGKIFCSIKSQKQHIKNIHRTKERMECPECKKMFKNYGSLETHKTNKHRGREEKHQCNQCKKMFSSSANLNRHTRQIHTTKRRKKCPDCLKMFKHHESLDEHRKREHSENGKPYKCNQCDWAFAHFSALKMHSIVHTNKRNHKCPVCRRVFPDANMLDKHKSRKHDDQKKTLIRTECEENYFYSGKLNKHKLTHAVENSAQKLFNCQLCNKKLSSLFSLDRHQKMFHNRNYLRHGRRSKILASKKHLNHHKSVSVNKKDYGYLAHNAHYASAKKPEFA